MILSAQDELQKFLDRRMTLFETAFTNLLWAYRRGPEWNKAVFDLADLIQKTMILADLHGRRRVLLERDFVARRLARRFDNVHDRIGGAIPDRTPIVPSVPFEEAIDDLMTREPRLASSAGEVSRLYSTEKVFAMARSASMKLTERVQKAVTDLLSGKESSGLTENAILDLAKEYSHEWTRSYAATVYRTNANTAYTLGRFEQAKDPDVAEVIPAFEFVSMDDERTRPNHHAANGLIAATNDVIWHSLKPPIGYQCFLPGTRVSGNFVGGLKAFYSGPAVEIETVNGNRLRVTVNHPVFACGKWVRAKDLSEGDYLLCDRAGIKTFYHRQLGIASPLSSGAGIDNQDMPPFIEDVFETLKLEGMRTSHSRLPMLSLNLHGDAIFTDGYIDVVGTNRLLPGGFDSFGENVEDFNFKFTGSSSSSGHCLSNFDASLKTFGSSTACLPSSGTLSFDLRSSHPRPLQQFRVGLGAKLNVISNEEARYSFSADTDFLRELVDASAGQIVTDQIVRVRRFEYVGHVYDLQTKAGWIISQNIVTSNCRCAVIFIDKYDLERRGLIKNGQVTRYEPPRFGNAYPDPGFRVGGLDF